MDLERNIFGDVCVEQCEEQFRPENLDNLGPLDYFPLGHMGL